MRSAFKNVLVVVKETPYEQYLQLKAQGKAPVALRWERLQNRFTAHKKCVDDVVEILQKGGIKYSLVRRDELHRERLRDKDLVIAVGGDGTCLNTASFILNGTPLLGVNSDPSQIDEHAVNNTSDERRSRGALCAISAHNVKSALQPILHGEGSIEVRTRSQCIVRSTYCETYLPPSLNDILVCHPIAAAVSRFRMMLMRGSIEQTQQNDQLFSFNVWSSGIWISTATGSTAAMSSAGGEIMDLKCSDLQYKVREHLVSAVDSAVQRQAGHGFIKPGEYLHLRWNSQNGLVFIDGSHMKHPLELGDEVKIDGNAAPLRLFYSGGSESSAASSDSNSDSNKRS